MPAAPSYSFAAWMRLAVRSGLLVAPWIVLAEGLGIAATAGGFALGSLGLSTVVPRLGHIP